MAITASDIKFKYSTKSGTAGDQNVGTAGGSLGKYISTTEIPNAQLQNLFDDVTGDENAIGDIEYRCFFIHNSHGSITLTNIKVWMSAEIPGGTNISVAVDNTGSKPVGQAGVQAYEAANENVPPTGGHSFTFPTSKAAGLSIATLTANSVIGIWLRRTATNSAPLNNDGVTIKIEGETQA